MPRTQVMGPPPRLQAGPPAAGRPRADRVARVRSFLQDLESDPAGVRAAIASLRLAELRAFNLNPFYLNLLTILGERHSPERVLRHAAAAVRGRLWRGWEFSRYLSHFDDGSARPRLDAWPTDLVSELLGRGRGLILCSFHLGAYRDLPTDLAIQGLRFTLPLTGEARDQTAAALARSPSRLLPEGHLLANVEERRGSLQVARALAAGGVVFAYPDGNSGQGGPAEEDGRVELELFGLPVRVKSGLARLAARYRTPILPLLALEPEAGVPRVVWAPPIEAPRQPGPGFEVYATAALYSFFEQHVLADVEQWEGGCFLHRWRVPPPVERDHAGSSPEILREVVAVLTRGRTLHLDTRRFAVLRTSRGWLCADTRALETTVDPLAEGRTIAALSATSGLEGAWLASRDEADRGPVLRFLASLWRQGGVTVRE